MRRPPRPRRPAARWRGVATSRSGEDPASGYLRRNVSPPGVPQPMQIVEVQFPPGARVAFETGARDRARAPAGVGARRRDRRHAGRGAPPVARRRLPGHAARPPDDVPQPDAKAHPLRGGDRVRNRPRDDDDTPTWSPRRLHAVDDAQIDELADVLIDCVEGGASVSFMHPLTPRPRGGVLAPRGAGRGRGRARAAGRRGRARRVRHRAAGARPAREPAAPRRPVEDAGASPRPPPGAGGGADARRRSRRARLRQDAAGARHRQRATPSACTSAWAGCGSA